MVTKRKRQKQTPVARALEFTFRQRHIQIILDKVLFLRFLRNLHGRFWGLAGILFMLTGFAVCFAIRPDMLHISTAFSDFGADVRTAPYFTGSVFFAAYGMWRWQQYLRRTWKHTRPIGGLMVLTVLGLYIIALMPVSWNPWPHRIHMLGVIIAGSSMLATVVLDWLLTKPRAGRYTYNWRFLRFTSLTCIIAGGWLTFGSADLIGWYSVALLGEMLLLGGYLQWIVLKTYMGEGNRTALAKILHKIVLVD